MQKCNEKWRYYSGMAVFEWSSSMQLKHLRTFVAVASTHNLTRAGEKLHRAQSSVTEQIQSLESDLGTALFDRSRRKWLLTPAGTRLLEYAIATIALSDEARGGGWMRGARSQDAS
jgi:DNA-binding transcriptional LysR family regulator